MLTLHDNSVSGEFPDEFFSVFVNGRKFEFSARRTMKDAEVPYAFGSFDSDEKVFVEIRSGGNLAGARIPPENALLRELDRAPAKTPKSAALADRLEPYT